MSKTIGLVGAVALGVTAIAGCGSSSSGGGGGGGSTANFAALRAQYTQPTGSLQSSDVPAVAKALGTDQSQSSGIPTGTASAPIHLRSTRSLQPMNAPVSCTAATASGVSCTCGGGGTMDETFQSGAQAGAEEGTITYSSCVLTTTTGTSSATESINGTMSYAIYTTAPTMEIYDGQLTVTITPPGTTTTDNFNYALVNGQLTYSVTIASGTVLVSASGSWDAATDSGSFTVTDKSGTWSCTATSGHGSCSGPSGSVTF